jgi:hypothetical protein
MEYKLQFLHTSPNNNFILHIKYLKTTNMRLMKTHNKVLYTACYWMTKIINLWGPTQYKPYVVSPFVLNFTFLQNTVLRACRWSVKTEMYSSS